MLALIVNGSPRKGGGTAALARAFGAALEPRLPPGSSVEVLDLADLRLDGCRGCRACFDRGEEACPLDDDLAWIAQRVLAADLLVLATPVYVDGMSWLMKAFIDRLAWLCHRPALGGATGFVLATTGTTPSRRAVGGLAAALSLWGVSVAGRLTLVAGARLGAADLGAAHPRIEAAARRLVAASRPGKGPRPGFRALLVFQVQRRIWLGVRDDSLDRRWWRASGLLDRGRRWRGQARPGVPSLLLARALALPLAWWFRSSSDS